MLPNHCQVLLTFIATVIPWYSLLVTGQNATTPDPEGSKVYPVDETKFNDLKKVVCDNVPAFNGGDGFGPWMDNLDDDEIYELAFINMAYGLTADAIAHLPVDLGWKKVLLDQIAYITRATCGSPAISSMFLTGVKNLFLYYMIKYENTLMNGTNIANQTKWKAEAHTEKWMQILDALSACAAKVEPIQLVGECDNIDSFEDKTGMTKVISSYDEAYSVYDPVDVVIDSIWWMFSTAYARCYADAYPKEDIILSFLTRFRDDIISFFTNRWKVADESMMQSFDIVFGPLTVGTEHGNLRMCATAAYDYEGLNNRHLVRPLRVPADTGGTIRNYKTEGLFGEDDVNSN